MWIVLLAFVIMLFGSMPIQTCSSDNVKIEEEKTEQIRLQWKRDSVNSLK